MNLVDVSADVPTLLIVPDETSVPVVHVLHTPSLPGAPNVIFFINIIFIFLILSSKIYLLVLFLIFR